MSYKVKRIIRGVSFLLKSYLCEKPRGLDFSMRQKSRNIKFSGNHGYALTQKKAFDEIMKNIEIVAGDAFVDIGCGKGGVLLYASKYNFARVAGIEIEDSLINVAKKNFKILKLDRVELFHDNAVTFERYAEFNVYFMFNPFDADIYMKVINRIVEATKARTDGKKVTLICYGASVYDYIEGLDFFVKKEQYTDDVRCTSVCIWESKVS